MICKDQKLSKEIFTQKLEGKEIRQGMGEGLLIAAENDNRVVVLTADLKESTRVHLVAEKFPERFFDCGVAEQAMITIASGMAACGKIPFTSSFAIFTPGRTWEQIRTTVCLNNLPVKIIGSYAGLSAGLDGGNHQALEDIALMRALPEMTVVVPADYEEAKKATLASAKTVKPTYLRTYKGETPVFTTEKTPFKIGKINLLWESKDPQVAIFACGPQVYEALLAAKDLDKKGIETLVINCHTIKPLDEQGIIHAAKITGAVVTVEEHQIKGGLGSAISEVLGQRFPTPIEIVGVNDIFGESGDPCDLRKKFGLTKEGIIEAIKRVITRKQES